jgi:hypothetical protein
VSDTTASVTVWLAEARATIAAARPRHDGNALGVTVVAQTLLAGVETALRIHSPIRAYWCQECSTSYPCKTRREIIAALLGETVDD